MDWFHLETGEMGHGLIIFPRPLIASPPPPDLMSIKVDYQT